MSEGHGLEKLTHLEDKIYRAIELFKRERSERKALERELKKLQNEIARLNEENSRFELQTERLIKERDAVKLKVEAMLDAIAVLELEPAEVAKK
ncbi:MAG TPA: hypothetical protein VJH03_26215 [Blastocatellia bacterium]|nr:hypothetical protein [Blastocatellia bacterium]